MLNRTNIALIVLLVAQLIVGGGIALTSNAPAAVSDAPLLAEFDADAVIEIVIEDGQAEEVRLSRSSDSWTLPSADNYPVNAEKVEDILKTVATFQSNRLIATNPTSHARLAVKDDEYRRKLTLVTDNHEYVLYFGTDGGVNTTHTRLDGDNNVYLTSDLSSWELQPQISSWIDTLYLDIDQESVTRLIVTNASGTYEFGREGIEWQYLGLGEGEEFNNSRMSTILRHATTIRMTQPLGLNELAEYGMDTPAITIEVVYEEPIKSESSNITDSDTTGTQDESDAETVEMVEKSYTIMIGEPLGNGDYVLKADTEDYYVQVRSSYVTSLSNVDHESLLVMAEDTDSE